MFDCRFRRGGKHCNYASISAITAEMLLQGNVNMQGMTSLPNQPLSLWCDDLNLWKYVILTRWLHAHDRKLFARFLVVYFELDGGKPSKVNEPISIHLASLPENIRQLVISNSCWLPPIPPSTWWYKTVANDAIGFWIPLPATSLIMFVLVWRKIKFMSQFLIEKNLCIYEFDVMLKYTKV